MSNTKIQSEQIADDVALAGSPTTTTQSASDNSTKVATTAYVTTAVANLVDSAPSSLNTLNELAAAMNDNASFFSTVLPLSGGTMTGDISHASDFTLDVGGDLNLDAAGGQLNFKDSGTTRVTFELDATPEVSFTGGNLAFNNLTQNADIAFKGFDDSSFITALNLDMSAAGEATFNAGIKLGDGYAAQFGASQDLLVYHSSNENIIQTNTSDQDLLFKGKDGSSTITALTLDMSAAGFATFNDGATFSGNVGIGTSSPSFTAVSGSTSQKGLHIQNSGNDTSAHLKLTGHNNTGTPGQATDFEIIHRGDALQTIFQHGGADVLTFDSSGNIQLSSTLISSNTSDGSDNKSIMINGGGAASDTRGGYVIVHGNEHSSNAGITRIHAGNVGTADIQFYTGGHQRAQIDSNGNLILKKNLVLESTSEGIDFSGVGSSANTLDDYEEGTWTLALNTSNSDAVITITNTTGSYTKIGDVVHVRIYTAACGVGSAGSGTVYISGLPFTVANTGGNRNYSAASFAHTNIFSTSYEAYGAISHSFAVVVQEGSISSATFATGNGKYMMFSLTYRTTQ